MKAKTPARAQILCASTLCVALIHGLLYVFLVPPWGHYDEPTHFEYAWLIANRLKLPQQGDYDQAMRREVAASMLEHGFFRDIPPPSNLLLQYEPIWIGVSELEHPPLYYLLIALPLRLVRHADVAFQLYLARLVSLLLYLASIAIAYRLLGELVAPGHPLRWAVPGTMALLPAYTDLMTAVNSDVGAVVVFSLFLWGAVRTIVRGSSPLRLAWVALASVLCVYTKNTAALAVVLVPAVLVLAWVHRPLRWPCWIGLAVTGLLSGVLLFSWGDAAAWYRSTTQTKPTSQEVADAPLGNKAIALHLEPGSQVMQPLPREDVEALQGETVTLGAWMWATQPVEARAPMLHDGQGNVEHVVQVSSVPTFHAITATISADADHVQTILSPSPGQPEPGVTVYYDGIVMAEGDRFADGSPLFQDAQGQEGRWGGYPFVNRVRNGSAEATWPYVRPWVDRALLRYARRSPSQFLASLLDWRHTGWVYRSTAVNLLQSFWARFGWNQIALPAAWYWGLAAITALGAAGAMVGGVRLGRSGPSAREKRAIWLLVLSGLLTWANTFLRPHPLVASPFIPGARYAYPAIIPSALALVSGWRALVPGRFRRWVSLGACAVLLSLDVASVWTLFSFYYGR